MPLIIPKDLLNTSTLNENQIFAINENKATSQDIRPINIAILNLMPKKEETELQLLKILSNTALQVNIDLIMTKSYTSKNTSKTHLKHFYKSFDQIKNKKYDGLIITGAPIETLDYENIEYWDELTEILDFAKENVYSTIFICWAAQAALHYYYGINHKKADEKIFGIFNYKKLEDNKILKGFDDYFNAPQSRHTYIEKEEIEKIEDLDLLSYRKDTGVGLATTKDNRFIFNFGHWEYDKDTLNNEYLRDVKSSKKINIPKNYYVDDNPENEIILNWKTSGNLFFSNWLNYCVYQETPYNIDEIQGKKVSKFGGSSLSNSKQFKKVKDIIFSEKDRNIIVVSAPGKSEEYNEKITDKLLKISDTKNTNLSIRSQINDLQNKLIENMYLINKELSEVENRFEKIIENLNIDDNLNIEVKSTIEKIQESNEKDFIISRGEYLNAKLMANYLHYKFIDAKDIIFFNNENEIDEEKTYSNIKSQFKNYEKIVVPGFYGRSIDGNIKIFKRGGSDLTGTIIASALDSPLYENWTDVDGIMSSDPNKNKDAKTIKFLNYSELEKIINDGAQVYQKDAIELSMKNNITIKFLNTNNPSFTGTVIKK